MRNLDKDFDGLEECTKMSDVYPNDLEELINALKLRRDHWSAELAKMESVLQKVGLVDEHLKLCDEVVEPLERLHQLENKFPEVKELSSNALALAHATRLRKQKNYSVKIRFCTKLYMDLNATMLNKIRELKSFFDGEEQQVCHIATASEQEMKTIEQKISRYLQEITRMEKHNPWLKNPQYSLPKISIEIEFLKRAQDLKDELLEELNRYNGLKPDLVEAHKQLAQLKLEYEETCNKSDL